MAQSLDRYLYKANLVSHLLYIKPLDECHPEFAIQGHPLGHRESTFELELPNLFAELRLDPANYLECSFAYDFDLQGISITPYLLFAKLVKALIMLSIPLTNNKIKY
jgi:hypothetical protein